ncbi:hypothetical protein [Gemmatimonas sp.]
MNSDAGVGNCNLDLMLSVPLRHQRAVVGLRVFEDVPDNLTKAVLKDILLGLSRK